MKLVVEPAAATGLAALLDGQVRCDTERSELPSLPRSCSPLDFDRPKEWAPMMRYNQSELCSVEAI